MALTKQHSLMVLDSAVEGAFYAPARTISGPSGGRFPRTTFNSRRSCINPFVEADVTRAQLMQASALYRDWTFLLTPFLDQPRGDQKEQSSIAPCLDVASRFIKANKQHPQVIDREQQTGGQFRHGPGFRAVAADA